jgi:hypothetical protein
MKEKNVKQVIKQEKIKKFSWIRRDLGDMKIKCNAMCILD